MKAKLNSLLTGISDLSQARWLAISMPGVKPATAGLQQNLLERRSP
ncbi:hypothetical protein [Pectobacterium parmentieri]|nr:hypothetical protein [Pectobacterium parmentieri]